VHDEFVVAAPVAYVIVASDSLEVAEIRNDASPKVFSAKAKVAEAKARSWLRCPTTTVWNTLGAAKNWFVPALEPLMTQGPEPEKVTTPLEITHSPLSITKVAVKPEVVDAVGV
jgi:hypothetical protein